MPGSEHPFLAASAQEVCEPCCNLRALRLFSGKKGEYVRIVAAEPGDELAIAQDDFGIGRAGQDPWSRLRVIVGDWQIRPWQD